MLLMVGILELHNGEYPCVGCKVNSRSFVVHVVCSERPQVSSKMERILTTGQIHTMTDSRILLKNI